VNKQPLPEDLESAFAWGNDKDIFELAYEAIERSRNRASCINFDVVPMWLEVHPVYPGLLDDPNNYVGVERSLWMKRNCRIVYVSVPKTTYDDLMGLYEKIKLQKDPPKRSPFDFDVVIKPNWSFGVKKINGVQWAFICAIKLRLCLVSETSGKSTIDTSIHSNGRVVDIYFLIGF
jgi:hypothetical protein